jgi:hypothetical protein
MRRLLLVVLLLSLSGCFDANKTDRAPLDAAVTPITVTSTLYTWNGTCPCPSQPLVLAEPLDPESWLEVRVRWDGTKVSDFQLNLTHGTSPAVVGVRGFDARRVQIWAALAGTYNMNLAGVGDYQAYVRIKSATAESGADRLPAIVTTVPVDIRIGSCDYVERTEHGATRCLRLGNGVANPGYGPLQVFLSYPEGALALGGQGHFVQQVLKADGTYRQKVVSKAEFHVAHGHWHYDGLAEFSLAPVDPDTGLRGATISAHKKAGFCFLDWDLLVEEETKAAAGGYAETACLVPWTRGWSNGVSAGWYDFYSSGLTDQYVDIAGVPDGLYEYMSVADPGNTLEETDPTDNWASALILLRNNSVEVLEGRGWYHVQPDDDPAQTTR